MIRQRLGTVGLLTILFLPPAAHSAAALELAIPSDPLRTTVSLAFGLLELDNASYAEFFGESELNTWSLRGDYRIWGPFRLGAGLSVSGKSKLSRNISLGSEAYPIRFNFTAFQGMGELYLRSHLPRIGFLRPHASIGALYSRFHVESKGYSQGYDASWEEYRPAEDVIQFSRGWRAALGLRFPLWANVTVFAELSSIELEAYDAPAGDELPVSTWDHSGRRLEIGLMQRF